MRHAKKKIHLFKGVFDAVPTSGGQIVGGVFSKFKSSKFSTKFKNKINQKQLNLDQRDFTDFVINFLLT